MDDFKVGDIVRSKVNTIYRGTYTITAVKKTVVWCEPNEEWQTMIGGKLQKHTCTYKNVPKRILEKVEA